MGFDEAYTVHPNVTAAFLTNDELMRGNWAKGRAGGRETDLKSGLIGRAELETIPSRRAGSCRRTARSSRITSATT